MSTALRVLVVGGGTVGRVFARHFLIGGAEVTFFVKESRRAELEHGFDIYPLNSWKKGEPEHCTGAAVMTSNKALSATRFDLIVLTVPSDALRGPWLKPFVKASGDAIFVSLQPSPSDRALLVEAGVQEARLIAGTIEFLAYDAPLAGETRMPRAGVAYWFPPLMRSAFSGPPKRVGLLREALKRGKLPNREVTDADRISAYSTPVLLCYVRALEKAGWSFKAFDKQKTLAADAAKEALAIVALSMGKAPRVSALATKSALAGPAFWALAHVAPFPAEAYLKKHFTKTAAQTRVLLDELLATAKAHGFDAPSLQALAK